MSSGWKFALDPPADFWKPDFADGGWSPINVPAHWAMEGFDNDSGIGGYRLRFALPAGSGRPRLRFEGVYSGAEVWVNGKLLCTHEGGAFPFEVDLAGTAVPGDNVLAVRVREHTLTSDELDHMSCYADFPLAGIFRPVVLFFVPEVHFGLLEYATTFDRDYRDATLHVYARVVNESRVPYRGVVEVMLAGPNEEETVAARAASSAVEIRPGESADVDLGLALKSPKAWNAEEPNLYRLSAFLRSGSEVTDGVVQRAGVRQTEIRGKEILVNGRPIKFLGTCYHDSHPLMGRAVTPDVTRRHLLLMKECNLNAVRMSHYPHVRELVELADEIGLYVEDEASFCWAKGGNDLRRLPRIVEITAGLIARDRNRPSVVFWSMCNETWGYGYAFERAHEWAEASDPSRPHSAGLSAWLEIATLHNPLTIARMDEHEGLDQPLLFDESLCIFQGIYNDTLDLQRDPGIRDYYGNCLPGIVDHMLRSRTTQGSFIWCWGDDLFCVPGRGLEYGRDSAREYFVESSYRMPGRGIVGDAPWGAVDGWLRRKPEFWHIKKSHSPVRIRGDVLPVPAAGQPIRVPVENRYDFLDLHALKATWGLGSEKGETACAIAPHRSGVIEIAPREPVKEGAALSLDFHDGAGRLIDTYRLALGKEVAAAPPCMFLSGKTLTRNKEELLCGVLERIRGAGFAVAIHTSTGLSQRVVVGKDAVLLELPALHVLRRDRQYAAIPDRHSWRMTGLDIKEAQDGNVVISVNGEYADFQGGYRHLLTPRGELETTATFKYIGEDMIVREAGLRFSVPRECDILQWERKGAWNVYPEDHIGRLRGAAVPFEGGNSGIPPTGPWALDPSPRGSNDFRSTKQTILWGGIHYPGGPGVLIAPEGEKHLRAEVESDRISVHVSDWYGGTGTDLSEWVLNYSRGKPIAKGATIVSKVKLRLVNGFGAEKAVFAGQPKAR